MTNTKEAICIDTDLDICLSSDILAVEHIEVPTVYFVLRSTDILNNIADSIRKELGFLPMFERSGEYDEYGWYDFGVRINWNSMTKVEVHIRFDVESPIADDNWDRYEIPLTEAEQWEIFALLNNQCITGYGKSCDEFLVEARQEMHLVEYKEVI